MKEKKNFLKSNKRAIKMLIIMIIIIAFMLPIFVYIVVMGNGKVQFNSVVARKDGQPTTDIAYYNNMLSIQNKIAKILNIEKIELFEQTIQKLYNTQNLTAQKTINLQNQVADVEKTSKDSTEFLSTVNVTLDEFFEIFYNSLTKREKEVLENLLGKDEEEQKKYLSIYLRASYATLFPDLRSKEEIGTPLNEDMIQGIIQIKRVGIGNESSLVEDAKILEYIPYEDIENPNNTETFMYKLNHGDTSVLNYFSLYKEINEETDNDNETSEPIQLVVASLDQTVKTKKSNNATVWEGWMSEGYSENATDPNKQIITNLDGSKEIKEIETTLYSKTIAYQNLVAPYALPFDLLWSLLAITEDKEFVYDLSKLVLGEESENRVEGNKTSIILTVQDSITVTETEHKYSYKKDVEYDKQITMEARANGVETETKTEIITTNNNYEDMIFYEDEIETTTTYNTYIDVSYADTWIIKYVNEYTNDVREEVLLEETNNKDTNPELADDVKHILIDSWVLSVENGNTQEEMLAFSDVKAKYNEFKAAFLEKIQKQNIRKCLNEKIQNANLSDEAKEFINSYKTYIINKIYNATEVNALANEIDTFLNNTDLPKTDKVAIKFLVVIPCYNDYIRISEEDITATILKVWATYREKKIDKEVYDYKKITSNTYKKGEPTIIEKIDEDSEEANFITIFNSHSKANLRLSSVPTWLFTLMEGKEKTVDMIDTMKWLLYNATGEEEFADIQINWESLMRPTSNYSSMGTFSAFGCNIEKEEFISKINAYSTNRNYIEYMAKYAPDFYDICTANNVNPVLAFAHAYIETGGGSSEACQQYHNYFGMGIGNSEGAEDGAHYNNPAESIQDFCDWLKNCANPTSYSYIKSMERAQEYATVNENFGGTPDTNIYILYCRYAYLGDTHIADESDFDNPDGLEAYEAQGSNWGSGGRYIIYNMYETGGLYTGKYKELCGHPHGEDETTTAERADYVVYATNSRIDVIENIFGTTYTGGGNTGQATIYAYGQEITVPTYTSTVSGRTFRLYKQAGMPWSGLSAGNGTIANRGCLITAMTTIMTGYNIEINPGDLAYIAGVDVQREFAERGLNAEEITKNDIKEALRQGDQVLLYVGEASTFTKTKHYMALLDISEDGNQVFLANPSRSGEGWYDYQTVIRGFLGARRINNK